MSAKVGMMARGRDVLRWLGVEQEGGEPEVLDSFGEVLDGLEESRARYVAAFAYLLGRVAGADLHIGDTEIRMMKRLIAEEAGLSEPEAAAIVTLALGEVRRFGGTHNVLVTREFSNLTTHAQRLALVRCLFALAAADSSVEAKEDNEIRRISRELRIEHADFVRARAEVRQHIAAIRLLSGRD